MAVPFEIEIALEEAAHAVGLAELGAHRIELCSNLAEGGLTPTVGQATEVVSATELPVYAMLRPRSGNFTYSKSERQQMLLDLEALAPTGISGIVFGALTSDGCLDRDFATTLVRRALDLNLGSTFHRAIDAATDPLSCLEDLATLGVERVLSSGGARRANEGKELLATMSQKTGVLMQIQAGSGVHAEVAESLWNAGIRAFHMTARYLETFSADKLGFDTQWQRDDQKISSLHSRLVGLSTRV